MRTSQKQMPVILIERTRHSVHLDYQPPCQFTSYNLQVTQSLMHWVCFSSKETTSALPLNTQRLGLRILHVQESEADAFTPSSKRQDTQSS